MTRLLAFVALVTGACPAFADVGPLPRADIFVLGEVHDNPAHHAEQARLVKDIAPKALVFEMLSPLQALAAAGVARDDPEALAKALDWADSGWPDFALYFPIFAAAPDAAIVGAAVPQEDLQAAMKFGAAQVFGAQARHWGLGDLDDAARAALTADQRAAHCGALPEEMLPGMVEAQRLRDADFARAAVGALDAAGGPVVLITGTGHARTDHGVPAAIHDAHPELTVWALGQLEDGAVPPFPFDAVNVTPAAEREDPCAALAQPQG